MCFGVVWGVARFGLQAVACRLSKMLPHERPFSAQFPLKRGRTAVGVLPWRHKVHGPKMSMIIYPRKYDRIDGFDSSDRKSGPHALNTAFVRLTMPADLCSIMTVDLCSGGHVVRANFVSHVRGISRQPWLIRALRVVS